MRSLVSRAHARCYARDEQTVTRLGDLEAARDRLVPPRWSARWAGRASCVGVTSSAIDGTRVGQLSRGRGVRASSTPSPLPSAAAATTTAAATPVLRGCAAHPSARRGRVDRRGQQLERGAAQPRRERRGLGANVRHSAQRAICASSSRLLELGELAVEAQRGPFPCAVTELSTGARVARFSHRTTFDGAMRLGVSESADFKRVCSAYRQRRRGR